MRWGSRCTVLARRSIGRGGWLLRRSFRGDGAGDGSGGASLAMRTGDRYPASSLIHGIRYVWEPSRLLAGRADGTSWLGKDVVPSLGESFQRSVAEHLEQSCRPDLRICFREMWKQAVKSCPSSAPRSKRQARSSLKPYAQSAAPRPQREFVTSPYSRSLEPRRQHRENNATLSIITSFRSPRPSCPPSHPVPMLSRLSSSSQRHSPTWPRRQDTHF